MSLPCSIKGFIPQKGKMSFEQILLKGDPLDSQSTVIIREDNFFLADNRQLSNAVLIEYINQLTAAVQGYQWRQNPETAPKGLFVGVQEANFYHPVFSGDTLSLKGFIREEISQVSFIQGVVNRGDVKIAELVTKVYKAQSGAELQSLTGQKQFPQQTTRPKLNQQLPDYLHSNLKRTLFTYLYDLKTADGCLSMCLSCPEDFIAFDGHFPRNPLLPGVVLLEIANLGLELLQKESLMIRSLKKMKIGGVVLPNQVVSCSIRVDGAAESLLPFTAIFQNADGGEISRFSGCCVSTQI